MLARLAPAVAVLLVACTTSGEADDPLAAPPLTLVEELRLDPNAEDFSVIPAVGVGPRGQIAVLQPQDGQVRLYDSTGARIATIGRRGSGPGEFQFPAAAGWVADTMWVLDIRLFRSVHVAPDGSVIRTSAMPGNVAPGAPLEGDTRGMGFFVPIGIRADGSMFGETYLRDSADPKIEHRMFVLAAPGATARIVAVPPTLDDERAMIRIDDRTWLAPLAPAPQVKVAPDASRFAWVVTELADAASGTLTLAVFDADGDTTLVRSYPFRGVEIPQSAKDSIVHAMASRAGGPRSELPPDLRQRYVAAVRERMPVVYPPVVALTLGLDETVWLTMRDTGDVRRALVLDGRGDPIGTFALPPRASIRHGTRTHVWMTRVDEDDLQTVLRYRLEPTR